MNRKVTEHLVYVRLMSDQSPIDDFAFRFGVRDPPWSEAISGLERPVPTAFLSPSGLLRNPERLPCGWCRDCWVWAYIEQGSGTPVVFVHDNRATRANSPRPLGNQIKKASAARSVQSGTMVMRLRDSREDTPLP